MRLGEELEVWSKKSKRLEPTRTELVLLRVQQIKISHTSTVVNGK